MYVKGTVNWVGLRLQGVMLHFQYGGGWGGWVLWPFLSNHQSILFRQQPLWRRPLNACRNQKHAVTNSASKTEVGGISCLLSLTRYDVFLFQKSRGGMGHGKHRSSITTVCLCSTAAWHIVPIWDNIYWRFGETEILKRMFRNIQRSSSMCGKFIFFYCFQIPKWHRKDGKTCLI